MNLRSLLPWKNNSPSAGKTTDLVNGGREVKWISLTHLPGFRSEAIRALGEMVFRPLTRTDVSGIEVIADLSGHGPHAPQDIDRIAHQLRCSIDPSRVLVYSTEQMEKLFGGVYQAQAIQFEGAEYTCLLVKDPMGSYIYRWPTLDTKRRIGGHGSGLAIKGPVSP